jgi:putative ABC transport system substrate-binding protein
MSALRLDNRRATYLLSLALALAPVFCPLGGEAQRAEKVSRVGILAASPPGSPGWRYGGEVLLQTLRELGYVEGRNLAVEGRYSEGRDERLPELAADLVRLKVDVIVAISTTPVHAARGATMTIPIVMTNHGDPVGSGLVVSLGRPGGNVTGLSMQHPELSGKRLQLLKAALPRLSRVAVLSNPANQVHPSMQSETDAAAQSLGLHVQRVSARGPADYDTAFAAIARERAEAVVVLGDLSFFGQRTKLAELAVRYRMPTMFAQREHVTAGGLLSYGVDLIDSVRRAATHVDRILRGASPADLPVEQPTKFDLVVNIKTAKALGLTIPQSLLLRADQVIE